MFAFLKNDIMMKKLLAAFTLTILLVGYVAQASAQDVKSESFLLDQKKSIPPSVFFAIPQKTAVTVSPDGRYLAYLAPYKETLNLFVEPIGGGEPLRLSAQSIQPVEDYQWANDETICYQVSSSDFTIKSIYASRISDPENRIMISGDGMDARLLRMNAVGMGVFHFMQKAPSKGGYDLCYADMIHGTISVAYSGEGSAIYDYFVGFDGGRTIALDLVENEIRLLNLEGPGRMQKVSFFPADRIFIPVAFDADNKSGIIAISNVQRSNAVLVSYDFQKGKEIKVIAEVPNCSILRTNNNLGSSKVLEVEYFGSKTGVKPIDPNYEKVRTEIASKLSDKTQFVLDNVDRQGNFFIIHTVGARVAPFYYKYNAANKELKEIVKTNRDLTPIYLTDITQTSFVNRDGKEVKASVLLPHSGSKQAPVVIYIPQDPGFSIYEQYNPELQLLANKGFVVWVVHFKGNSDNASKLIAGDLSAWTEAFTKDLIDAAKHLVTTGIAHPDKISLIANGFAGPFAMRAMSLEPDLFLSGVFMNAVFDMKAFLSSNSGIARNPDQTWVLIKNGSNQFEGLGSFGNVISGSVTVKQPLLFAFANYDEYFPSSQSNDASVALAKMGNAPEIVSVDDGHDLHVIDNKIHFWESTIEFLNRKMSDVRSTKTSEPIPNRDDVRRRQ
jgi:hypothetical protein